MRGASKRKKSSVSSRRARGKEEEEEEEDATRDLPNPPSAPKVEEVPLSASRESEEGGREGGREREIQGIWRERHT